jgi:hypothetical protein
MRYVVGAVASDSKSPYVFAGEGISTIWMPTEARYAEANRIKVPAAKIFDASSGKVIASSAIPRAPLRKAVWDPLGRYVAFIDSSQRLFVWNKEASGFNLVETHLPSPGFSLDVSPNGEQIAAATNSGVFVYEFSHHG